jgi:hypothetical protein
VRFGHHRSETEVPDTAARELFKKMREEIGEPPKPSEEIRESTHEIVMGARGGAEVKEAHRTEQKSKGPIMSGADAIHRWQKRQEEEEEWRAQERRKREEQEAQKRGQQVQEAKKTGTEREQVEGGEQGK